jgi:hypothetical protein
MVIQTSWMASEVNSELSTATMSSVPAGRVSLIRATSALASLAICRSLAWL